jgi:replicative DNA helicase
VTRDEAKKHIKNNYKLYFEQHLSKYEKGSKSYPLCPSCKKHEIQVDPKRKGYYTCFTECGISGDVFEFIGLEYSLKSFKEKMDKAIEIYEITIDKESKTKEPKDLYMELKQDTDVISDEKTNYTKYYEKISKNVDPTSYLLNRGISPKLQEEFKIGFDPKWQSPTAIKKSKEEDISSIPATPRIIIPTSDYSYSARSTKDNEKYKMIKEGESHLFNPDALKSNNPVFITEGEIDALSILECGVKRGIKAVGLGSTVNKGRLISRLKDISNNNQYNPQIILYLDSDSHGKEASKKLMEELAELKISCVDFYELIKKHKEKYKDSEDFKEDSEYLETLLKIKDPNDALKNDKDKFEQELLYEYAEIKCNHEKFREEVYEDSKIEIGKMNSSDEKRELLEYIRSSVNKPALATGFNNLDEILNGGLKGGCLYGIGAVPSLGKTTLTMQIADHIAEYKKRNVCIFSLEMSKYDLILKSIVRETYKKSSMPDSTKSVSEIQKIKNNDEYNELIKNSCFKEGINHYFNEIKPYIYIYQGIGDIGINKINKTLKDFTTTNPDDELPMIIIDYIQILAPYDGGDKTKYTTDKQNLDKNIMELKRIARDKNIPIIVISSFNRDNYASEVSFKSFKESGAIEYSSDVIIGLQLKIDKTELKEAKLKEEKTLQLINEAKNKNPREVELVVLKNRFGKPYEKIPFEYYPQYDFFKEVEPEEFNLNQKKSEKRGRARNLYNEKK